MQKNTRCVEILVLMSLLLALGSGCSRLNPENYDKITIGMPYTEVVSILGKPDVCNALMAFKNCRWGGESKNIQIKFAGDKVAFKSAHGLGPN